MNKQKKIVSVGLDKKIIEQIEVIGSKKGMSKQEVIRYFIADALSKENENKEYEE